MLMGREGFPYEGFPQIFADVQVDQRRKICHDLWYSICVQLREALKRSDLYLKKIFSQLPESVDSHHSRQ